MKHVSIRPMPEVRDTTPEEVELGESLKHAFLDGIRYLAEEIDHPLLEKLGRDALAVLRNNYAEIAMGDVPSLTMTIMAGGGGVIGLVIIPPNWIETCKEDSAFQFGGIVFVASQVVDYYNMRQGFRPEIAMSMSQRAKAFEAEYIKSLDIELNPYQKDVLSQFPNGWDGSLEYERKPVEMVN